MAAISKVKVLGETHELHDAELRQAVGDIDAVLDAILEGANPEFGATLDEINGEVI